MWSSESQGQQYKENDGKLHGDVTLVDDGESADTDTVRDFRFHSSTAAAATCCRFLQCAFVLKTQISSCKLTAGNDSFILYSYQNNIKQFATTKSVLPSYTDTYACSCKKKNDFRLNVKPVLNWANVCSPNIPRTVRRTMIRFSKLNF